MKRLIPQYGDAVLQSRGDAFVTLARSIVGQQISVKAAQTVWERFAALPRRMTPAAVLKLKIDDMRAAGLSARKVEYLVDLALHFDAGKLHVDGWHGMEDEAIIAELVAIRGIGRWTAEMFLIFHLLRPNVLPLDDVGLINGISQNYFSGDPVSRSDAREVAQAWQPWCSARTTSAACSTTCSSPPTFCANTTTRSRRPTPSTMCRRPTCRSRTSNSTT